ncbi:MAG: WD40 repeat domain-containing serine/threonine-protein kinase [Cyanobacteria bacterium J06621_15]
MSYCLNPHCEKHQNPKDSQYCLSCGTALLLKQRYRAIKPIGQGGFGRTLLAVDESQDLKPPCVIKQFLPQAQGTDNIQKAAELFEQEALRLNDLGKHNQIPNLLDYLIQDEHQYLVQEYIDGYNLTEILKEKGSFNENQIRDLLNSLLPVLEFIHSHDVIHRDIKPQNIISNKNGKLYLVDFGAAKVVTGTAILQTGTSIGTPEFVAPEQSRGKATYSSDLYSLGATCTYLLTGISPFDLFDIYENTWVWKQYLVDNPVSEQLAHILDKLIENAISRRYQSASGVLKDIKGKNKIAAKNNRYSNHKFTDKKQKHAAYKQLNNSFGQLIYSFNAHTNIIDSVAVSQDGNFLASGSYDSIIKLWKINNDEEFSTEKIKAFDNQTEFYTFAFSPDGLILASSDSVNDIHLWDVSSGELINLFKGHRGWFTDVNCLAFTQNGQVLVSAGGDKTIKLWDVSKGENIRTFKGHNSWINSVAISSDRKVIATSSHDYTIKLWELATGRRVCTFKGHGNWVRCMTFNPIKNILASSGQNNDIKLWDINTKKEISTLTGHSGKVNSLAFTPDGQILFSGSEDKTIKVWLCEEF